MKTNTGILLGLILAFGCRGADIERPNILWLTSEDNSAEWIGCYGNALAKTPNIDQLANEGFRYTHTFANIPVCSPTRGAWITGIHALSLGIQPMRSRHQIPHDRIPYYPDLLRARGYFTGNSTKTDYNIGGRADQDCWDHQGKVDWEMLPKRQPFFQVVNTAASHESRAHGSVENTRCDPEDVVLAKYHPDIPPIRKNYAKYYDAIENMDKDIGIALARLDELGLADNTIVIHNSDHGGVMPRSKRFLFNSSIHVPLIVRIPEAYAHLWPAETPGMTVDRLVSFIDMPKTWMSLAGAQIPDHMQGTIFLGPDMEPENEFSFGFSERQGDAVDCSRSVRGKRYYYIKRYMPYVPWGQHASYTWKMKATQAWEAHHKAGLTDEITGRFFRPKPHSEELYDTQTDPDCIHNLIEDPKHARRIEHMRRALRAWQEEIHDSGLLPEEDRAKRAAENGVTIYDMVRNPKLYDLPAYLDAADLAIANTSQNLPRLAQLLKHDDAGVRYWGVIGCLILRDKAASLTPEIHKMADDESHEVRAMAAYHLFRIGEKEIALAWLKNLLEGQTYASMKTLTVINWIGQEARPLVPAIKKFKPEGQYTKQRQGVVLANFAAKVLGSGALGVAKTTVLVEAESFSELGGWVLDTQVMDQMGSPYLLAHGLGRPVEDATATVKFPGTGEYRLWVRTRDWVGQWKKEGLSPAMRAEGFPGKFQLSVNGKAVGRTFGTEGARWHWQDGGVVPIDKRKAVLRLHDLTGFGGRCDALVFSTDHELRPPNSLDALDEFRRELLGYSDSPRDAGEYDIVVVGGGMAGICTAISAARGGCRVALIQNRPVLGGNNSSEVRVGLSGLVRQAPYPKLGNLVDEIGPVGHWNKWEADRAPGLPRSKYVHHVLETHPEKMTHNAGPASNYEDQKKLKAVLAEKNISLFLNMHVNAVTKDGSRITSVIGQDTRTSERLIFKGRIFADCTGDGNLGFMAQADFRVGREAKSLTEETLAVAKPDTLVMGTSVQWYSETEDQASTFPECPWAVQFDEHSCTNAIRGDWDWETGAHYDQVIDFEHIRDYGLRVVFGNWAVLKNHERFREQFAKRRLEWVAYIGGKRESRRLLGDVILCQHDIEDQKVFGDACVTTTWTIDLHYPKTPLCACDAFRSEARTVKISPYPIPYRCLYSRNIDNLMMAGRNISVTHVALGTVRVMRTTGMMGEVLGMAASVCKQHACDPRDVYTEYWTELKELMQKGVPFSSFAEIQDRQEKQNGPRP